MRTILTFCFLLLACGAWCQSHQHPYSLPARDSGAHLATEDEIDTNFMVIPSWDTIVTDAVWAHPELITEREVATVEILFTRPTSRKNILQLKNALTDTPHERDSLLALIPTADSVSRPYMLANVRLWLAPCKANKYSGWGDAYVAMDIVTHEMHVLGCRCFMEWD